MERRSKAREATFEGNAQQELTERSATAAGMMDEGPEATNEDDAEDDDEDGDADHADDVDDPNDPEGASSEVDTLLCLAQMDAEAAAAYEAAAATVASGAVAQLLRDFAADHLQHAADFRRLVTQLEGGFDVLALPDPETATFVMMAEALSELGTSASLRALIATESFTNSAYGAALELIAQPAARAILERHFGDEQRHSTTLARLLERSAFVEDRPGA